MRAMYTFLLVLASALTYTEAKPDSIRSVNIIRRFTQDLQASPAGYVYHRHSDNVHPGDYNADVNHGNARISGQAGSEKLEEMKMHGQSGTYRVAGGYGFVISHDYGSQRSHSEAPYPDVHSGASTAEPESITVLQFDTEDSSRGGTSADGSNKSESDLPANSEGLDSYVGKEIYESYMEYDKLVKDGEKTPSVMPKEYYGSDVHDEREKYHSDDGYDGSNNDGDKGRYVESEKYDGSGDYKENEYYCRAGGHDDKEAVAYVYPEEYRTYDDINTRDRAGLYRGYDESENDNYENYEPLKTSDKLSDSNVIYGPSSMYVESDSYIAAPNIEDFEQPFLKDFFKEFNHFSKGANIQAGYANDHGLSDNHEYNNDHGYDKEYYGDHGLEYKDSFYGQDGEGEEGFFDDADSIGFHQEDARGEKNSKFGEKKGHKKGSKTTGYHNVLHKDDYTKDHTFYADAKKFGEFDKGGSFGEHNSEHEEDYEKGSNQHSHSRDDHRGKKNSEDKGYFVDDDIGHHDEYGYNTYVDDNLDYIDEGDSYHESEQAYGLPHYESDY